MKENKACRYGFGTFLSQVQWLARTKMKSKLWLASRVSERSTSDFFPLLPMPKVTTDQRLAGNKTKYRLYANTAINWIFNYQLTSLTKEQTPVIMTLHSIGSWYLKSDWLPFLMFRYLCESFPSPFQWMSGFAFSWYAQQIWLPLLHSSNQLFILCTFLLWEVHYSFSFSCPEYDIYEGCSKSNACNRYKEHSNTYLI